MEPKTVHCNDDKENVAPKDCGPCRQNAKDMLRRRISSLRVEANNLEALHEAIENAPEGAEEALWQIASRAGWPY